VVRIADGNVPGMNSNQGSRNGVVEPELWTLVRIVAENPVAVLPSPNTAHGYKNG
jgi:hypothetical protein